MRSTGNLVAALSCLLSLGVGILLVLCRYCVGILLVLCQYFVSKFHWVILAPMRNAKDESD